MGYTTSTIHGIEVPDSSETNNIPEDIGKVVTALEGGSIAKRLTGAAIAALTAPQKPAGLLVYNTTTNKLQISDGTNFADVDATAVSALGIANAALPKAGGTMAGAIAMGGSKVTGLGSGTATGDAVTKGQLDAVSGRVTGGYVEWATSGSGVVTVTLPALPSGASNWFMTVNGTVAQPWVFFVQISGTTATVYIADANTGVGIGGGVSVSFFYTAVAV